MEVMKLYSTKKTLLPEFKKQTNKQTENAYKLMGQGAICSHKTEVLFCSKILQLHKDTQIG